MNMSATMSKIVLLISLACLAHAKASNSLSNEDTKNFPRFDNAKADYPRFDNSKAESKVTVADNGETLSPNRWDAASVHHSDVTSENDVNSLDDVSSDAIAKEIVKEIRNPLLGVYAGRRRDSEYSAMRDGANEEYLSSSDRLPARLFKMRDEEGDGEGPLPWMTSVRKDEYETPMRKMRIFGRDAAEAPLRKMRIFGDSAPLRKMRIFGREADSSAPLRKMRIFGRELNDQEDAPLRKMRIFGKREAQTSGHHQAMWGDAPLRKMRIFGRDAQFAGAPLRKMRIFGRELSDGANAPLRKMRIFGRELSDDESSAPLRKMRIFGR